MINCILCLDNEDGTHYIDLSNVMSVSFISNTYQCGIEFRYEEFLQFISLKNKEIVEEYKGKYDKLLKEYISKYKVKKEINNENK